jgi:hypothetical protein
MALMTPYLMGYLTFGTLASTGVSYFLRGIGCTYISSKGFAERRVAMMILHYRIGIIRFLPREESLLYFVRRQTVRIHCSLWSGGTASITANQYRIALRQLMKHLAVSISLHRPVRVSVSEDKS